MALAEGRQWMTNYCLARKPVDCGPKSLVEIEASQKPLVCAHPREPRTEHYSLHHIGCPQTPDLAGEHYIVRAMHLGQMIKAARLPWERYTVAPAAKFDFKESFGDVQVRGSILAHGSQLEQVGLRSYVANCKEQVERADDIVGLHEVRVMHIHHRVRRRGTFANMYCGVRLKLSKNPLD